MDTPQLKPFVLFLFTADIGGVLAVAQLFGRRSRMENEIHEVTPEMIAAGLEAYAGFNDDFESPEDMLVRVYEAMSDARAGPPS